MEEGKGRYFINFYKVLKIGIISYFLKITLTSIIIFIYCLYASDNQYQLKKY
ncbi:hypothetical protein BAOM_2468 [Peribacillus asahii]|uniref:Uncharacterized protein n=1 Tax=Peribacillus asahii TaxID=228899 RepID=A0A3T0KRQ3_9BACI|nr:hypothetical protein BAOM_2468 [Peribacillus asahii]